MKRWISGNTEQEYAENLIRALNGGAEIQFKERKHNFRSYAQKWFESFAKPNIELVTAITYERQLKYRIYPALGEMDIEDIMPADIQRIFNGMEGARETKVKTRNVLNMILEQAIEDRIIQRNPLKSRSIRITGNASKPIEPYTVEQMRFLVAKLGDVQLPQDRAYLALHALHPLRPEEIWGLKWKDISFEAGTIRIERAVIHPDRNRPQVKETKTGGSRRTLDLVPQIILLLERGASEDFVLGGEHPLSYTQVRRMCARIQKDTGFEERITPRRFRTTVLTDLYDATKDIKQAQAAAGHTTAAMTLKHYVKGRTAKGDTASPIARTYGLES